MQRQILQRRQNNVRLRHISNTEIQVLQYRTLPSLVRQLNHVIEVKQQNNLLPQNQSLKVTTLLQDKIITTQQTQIHSEKIIPFQNLLSKVFYVCSFQNFTSINFWNVQFANCQFFGFMKFPHIRSITFEGSKVHNFKPLTKARLPSLYNIDIAKNCASVLDLSRKKFNDQHKVCLMLQVIDIHPTTIHDLSCLAKIQPKGLASIMVQGVYRIRQPKVNKVLGQKMEEELVFFHERQ